MKCVPILLNAGAPVSVMINSAGRIYIAPHPNLMQNLMVLLPSGIIRALSHLLKTSCVADFSKKPTTLPSVMLIGFQTYLPKLIVPLDPSAIILTKRAERTIVLSQTLSQPYNTTRKSREKSIWNGSTNSKTLMIMRRENTSETPSTSVHGMPRSD